jgi:hypothetical protein
MAAATTIPTHPVLTRPAALCAAVSVAPSLVSELDLVTVRDVLVPERLRLCDCEETFAAESVFEMVPLTAVIVAGGVPTQVVGS